MMRDSEQVLAMLREAGAKRMAAIEAQREAEAEIRELLPLATWAASQQQIKAWTGLATNTIRVWSVTAQAPDPRGAK